MRTESITKDIPVKNANPCRKTVKRMMPVVRVYTCMKSEDIRVLSDTKTEMPTLKSRGGMMGDRDVYSSQPHAIASMTHPTTSSAIVDLEFPTAVQHLQYLMHSEPGVAWTHS